MALSDTQDLPRNFQSPRTPLGKVAKGSEERFALSTGLRKQLNKVFPDHWSFMKGEIAL